MTQIININKEQTMTSLEIAELTGKQHKNIMQAIRNMEPAWEKVQGLKFQLLYRIYNLPNGGTKEVPCYVHIKHLLWNVTMCGTPDALYRVVPNYTDGFDLFAMLRGWEMCRGER